MLQVEKEPDTILVLSIHRLNCLLDELDKVNLSSFNAAQKTNILLHTILSHLSNLTQTTYFVQVVNNDQLSIKAEQVMNQIKTSLKQLIGFGLVIEQAENGREVIMAEILEPVKTSLRDFLMCIQQ